MNKRKIINDPVYGFTTIPDELIYDLMQHPFFQRLRRIKQLGLSDYVYPGASHSRFQHALGALHLMTIALDTLKSKGIRITDKEAQGAQIAILLHDIGHSPYSHALEKKLLPISHEAISLGFMRLLDVEFKGKLQEAIRIFTDSHPKRFLHQLVSGQLDLDRMDYLNRDSFFTGVAEGIIGYERLIKMLNVKDNQLVVEEKGLYSIEKFLQSRRIMYWQVYLHKTVIAAEKMLIFWLELVQKEKNKDVFPALLALESASKENQKKMLRFFSNIDDTDVNFALKTSSYLSNSKIQLVANSLLNRKLFKCILSSKPFERTFVKDVLSSSKTPEIYFLGKESNEGYNEKLNEIMVLRKNNTTLPLSQMPEFRMYGKKEVRYYFIHV